MIFALSLALVFTFLGLSENYQLLRYEVLAVAFAIAFEAFTTRRYYWGDLFFVFGILFNPFYIFSLSRLEWQITDALLLVTLLAWYLDFFRSYHKGLQFEKFIQTQFPDREWVLVSWTKDLHKRLRRFVESDANPDFVFRKRSTGKSIAVECKYRSEYVQGTRGDFGIWWRREQGERYAKYGTQANTPVYIAFGLGGNPKNPKRVAYVPIEIIQKQFPRFIPREVFENSPSTIS